MYHYDPGYIALSARAEALAGNGDIDSIDSSPIPDAFRSQVWRILSGVVGSARGSIVTVATDGSTILRGDVWKLLHETVAQEIGIKPFPPGAQVDYESVLQDFLIRPEFTVGEYLRSLDLILQVLKKARPVLDSTDYQSRAMQHIGFDAAITELNHRMRQNGLPYEIDTETWMLFRVDSQLVNAEVVRPAIGLMRGTKFQGAESEFATSLDHHRNGRQKDAVTAANSAFESVLKQICDERGIKRSGSESGGRLLKLVIAAGVLPKELGGAPNAIERMYGSALNSLRDQKSSAHGGGKIPTLVEDHVATFTIHSAAALILLLVEAHQTVPLPNQ